MKQDIVLLSVSVHPAYVVLALLGVANNHYNLAVYQFFVSV